MLNIRRKDDVPCVPTAGTIDQLVPYSSVDERFNPFTGVQNQCCPQSQIGSGMYVLRTNIQSSNCPELVIIDQDLTNVVDDFDGEVGNVL
jgi:hypothetical protein